jgi:S-disulfanyl-L-cysteine oxidoreductase SoxD
MSAEAGCRGRRLVLASMMGLAVALGACDRDAADAPFSEDNLGARHAASIAAALPVAASEAVTGRLGIGRAATAEEVAALDIDVMPDGTGLPEGSGTAALGAPLFRTQCASCHGMEGEGTPLGARLVGRNPGDAFDFSDSLEKERSKTIGNYWPYATTIFDYTRRAMPFDRPGSLSDEDVYALTAWMLWKNEIIAENAVIDRETLPAVVMPAHDRFIPDDRLESNRVR